MKQILQKLYAYQTLTESESYQVLSEIASSAYHDAQVTAFISAFMLRGISLQELLGFRKALLSLCHQIDLEGRACIDIVGTGGDGKNTFNISTLSCFVVAAAGMAVCKHGNYAASSVSGSSNVMEQLGYRFSKDETKIKREIDECGLTFLHAPLFHPALKAVSTIRKNLGLRTFFNLLGPLVNPAQPMYHTIGVYHLEVMRLYQYFFQTLRKPYVLIHSLDGYDEVSLTSATKLSTPTIECLYAPSDLTHLRVTPQDIEGGKSVEDAKHIFLNVLLNKASAAQKEVVVVNSAFALWSAGMTANLSDAKMLASEALESGKAYSVLTKILSYQSSSYAS